MRKIKMYTVISADGLMCRPDGDIDWMIETTTRLGCDLGRGKFMASVSEILMNRNHYMFLRTYDLCGSCMGKGGYIVTDAPFTHSGASNVEFILSGTPGHTDITGQLKELKNRPGGDIWLAGDHRLIHTCLDAGLVDEITVTLIPTTLLNGIRLFPKSHDCSRWSTSNPIDYGGGITQMVYISQTSITTLLN